MDAARTARTVASVAIPLAVGGAGLAWAFHDASERDKADKPSLSKLQERLVFTGIGGAMYALVGAVAAGVHFSSASTGIWARNTLGIAALAGIGGAAFTAYGVFDVEGHNREWERSHPND